MKKETHMKLRKLIERVMREESKLNYNRDYEKLWKNLTNRQRHTILNKVYGGGYEVSIQLAQPLVAGTIPLEQNVSDQMFIQICRLLDGGEVKL